MNDAFSNMDENIHRRQLLQNVFNAISMQVVETTNVSSTTESIINNPTETDDLYASIINIVIIIIAVPILLIILLVIICIFLYIYYKKILINKSEPTVIEFKTVVMNGNMPDVDNDNNDSLQSLPSLPAQQASNNLSDDLYIGNNTNYEIAQPPPIAPGTPGFGPQSNEPMVNLKNISDEGYIGDIVASFRATPGSLPRPPARRKADIIHKKIDIIKIHKKTDGEGSLHREYDEYEFEVKETDGIDEKQEIEENIKNENKKIENTLKKRKDIMTPGFITKSKSI